MKEYHLNYYPDFKCIAGECVHSCCKGWHIRIDANSLKKYKANSSPFATTLKKGISLKKSVFKRDKKGHCAFLNDKGLCEIIINLGEQSLCQVCSDHPRFKSFFEGAIETGLGFSCEQATKVVLSFSDKISSVLVKDDECTSFSLLEQFVISFRASVLEIIQDRSTPITDRIERVLSLCNAQVGEQDHKKILNTFLTLERLDKNWGRRLKSIKNKAILTQTPTELSLYAEQFLANSIYRHVSGAEDSISARARMLACIFSWWIINTILEKEQAQGNFELVCDIVREFSAEVEYSQKNLCRLYKFSSRYIKI